MAPWLRNGALPPVLKKGSDRCRASAITKPNTLPVRQEHKEPDTPESVNTPEHVNSSLSPAIPLPSRNAFSPLKEARPGSPVSAGKPRNGLENTPVARTPATSLRSQTRKPNDIGLRSWTKTYRAAPQPNAISRSVFGSNDT